MFQHFLDLEVLFEYVRALSLTLSFSSARSAKNAHWFNHFVQAYSWSFFTFTNAFPAHTGDGACLVQWRFCHCRVRRPLCLAAAVYMYIKLLVLTLIG